MKLTHIVIPLAVLLLLATHAIALTSDWTTDALTKISEDAKFGPETANAIEQMPHLGWVDNALKSGSQEMQNGIARTMNWLDNSTTKFENLFNGIKNRDEMIKWFDNIGTKMENAFGPEKTKQIMNAILNSKAGKTALEKE